MDIINDQKKCMASLAVFKQLFNSGHNIFSIIAEFVKQEIISNGLTDFTEQRMHDLLLENNGFDVPQAVIRTAMKKIPYLNCMKGNAIVSAELTQDECSTFRKQMDEATNTRERISKRLIAYANEKRNVSLTKEEEKELCKSFYTYVVDDKAPVYFSELACSFILENEQDSDLQKYLNLIREGAISFIGLTYYNNSYGTVDSFDKDIYIYLETEILFHMAGYNGLTYQNLFEEFYNQVLEINKQHQVKKGKKIIHLRYFNETLKEIDDYFDQAEKIVRRTKLPDPSKAAMHTLTSGVSEPSIIADKRAEFNKMLNDHGIQYDDFTYDLTRDNGTCCIDYEAFIKDKEPMIAKRIYSDLTLLNWIYIKRGKRHVNSFANIRAVLLTGNYHVMQLAMDEKLRQPNEIALSTTLDFLTTRFWFSLCRGLSKDCNLLSANVLTKARLALASLNCESIDKAYREIEIEINQRKYDKEVIKSRIAMLRHRFRMPEDVDDLTEKNKLAFFTDCNTDTLLAEEAAKDAAHKQEIKSLTTSLEERNKAIEEQTDKYLRVLKDRLIEINQKEKQEFEEKIINYNASKKDWVNKQMKKYKKKMMFVIISFSFLLLTMIIIPLIVPCIPSGYSWCSALLVAFLSVFNRISALKNSNISKGLDYCCKAKRGTIRLAFEDDYCKMNSEPILKLTSLNELKKSYEKE